HRGASPADFEGRSRRSQSPGRRPRVSRTKPAATQPAFRVPPMLSPGLGRSAGPGAGDTESSGPGGSCSADPRRERKWGSELRLPETAQLKPGNLLLRPRRFPAASTGRGERGGERETEELRRLLAQGRHTAGRRREARLPSLPPAHPCRAVRRPSRAPICRNFARLPGAAPPSAPRLPGQRRDALALGWGRDSFRAGRAEQAGTLISTQTPGYVLATHCQPQAEEDMCIDPSMRPKIRRLSETYIEQLFGLDDQLGNLQMGKYLATSWSLNLAGKALPLPVGEKTMLQTWDCCASRNYRLPEIYPPSSDLKAAFREVGEEDGAGFQIQPEASACCLWCPSGGWWNHLVDFLKTTVYHPHDSRIDDKSISWRDITIMPINEDAVMAEKMARAKEHSNFRFKKYVFCHWHAYVKDRKKQLRAILFRIQQTIYYQKQIIMLTKWREKARRKYKMREDEMLLQHEIHLKTWKSKFKPTEDELTFSGQSVSKVSFVFDISLLPERAILQVCMHLCVFTSYFHNACFKNGFMNLTCLTETIFQRNIFF
ncbi:Dynein regulatory complex subunit 6, partial [Galemys pyrenaicus]